MEANTSQQKNKEEYQTVVVEERKEEPHDEGKAKSQRQNERLKIIRLTIICCFIGIGVLIVIMFIDLCLGEKNIVSSPLFISLTGILGAVLSTAIGGIVGSSIN